MDMTMVTGLVVVLVGQLFFNIGYMINLSNRVTKIETHLLYLMQAHGLKASDEVKALKGG